MTYLYWKLYRCTGVNDLETYFSVGDTDRFIISGFMVKAWQKSRSLSLSVVSPLIHSHSTVEDISLNHTQTTAPVLGSDRLFASPC